MVSEAEVLTAFLLERLDFDELFPEGKFSKNFNNAPDEMVQEFHKTLKRRYLRRLDRVNAVVQQISNDEAKRIKISEEELAKNKTAKADTDDIVVRLDDVSKLLDKEIESLEQEVSKEQRSLEDLLAELENVAIPKTESIDKESLSRLIELLEKFESLQE
ncbi:unnamed protein product [Cyberlindnera jadinii]|uniref:Uncharacterized protein n=1 Tax=Cyberlindnera jadinii (strain ATCC 18201 / CBS 1600 / BCRC 20928 / JCM 3617 / NBRC 0987 / NRRL Y-1542) TaxID=983966 RepID=A0A0H5BYP8_CYBJN|nr:hypothetical protein CYBJADRAFT_159787 [Cyberlindnera jadinii NRRL Y-1542]ODV75773.1 hypothetical protein CYBJADRAFT_159787 [Cyberlindnera jadinii NRRL Y-1542]CEP20486.1 unnamed protein product [Cyberlindnera jadinii]